jgi:hypothetical protein
MDMITRLCQVVGGVRSYNGYRQCEYYCASPGRTGTNLRVCVEHVCVLNHGFNVPDAVDTPTVLQSSLTWTFAKPESSHSKLS